jgi:hypothetical protein
VLATAIVRDVLHPHHDAPSVGTAPVVPGQRTNILPVPNFLDACSSSHYDDSPHCTATTLQAIDNARIDESLPPMVLPTNWEQLSPVEQLFVATDLERTARGLPPITGMVASLNSVAARAATDGVDPQLTAGGSITSVGANWIQGYGDPLEVIYEWSYDDGLGSSNVDCTRQNLSSCWGHRANVLLPLACSTCGLGAAFVPTDSRGEPLSFAEILVESGTTDPVVFSWDQEQPFFG